MPILLLLLSFLAGCTLPLAEPRQIHVQGQLLLEQDTQWQGEVVIDGEVTVAHGVTLNIAPGTLVSFIRRDKDRDGLGDATIIVKGSLVAQGTQQKPIRFFSAEAEPKPADWLEIRSDFAQELLFDWCEFRDSAYTLHAHFTRGHMRNCHIHHNIDGCRLGRSKFLFQYNLVEENEGKGINFRDSEVTLVDNIIRHNRAGIFLFEKPGDSVISRNNIYQNEQNLQLGDFFAEDISLTGNWWGSSDPQMIQSSIYDQQDDSELGQVNTLPAPDRLFAAGIQYRAQFMALWQVPTQGFIDSSPVMADGVIYIGSWDGQVRAVDPSGQILWSTETGDVIDADLLIAGETLYGQNWSRKLFQLRRSDGRLQDIYAYPGSPADDHRQAGLVKTEKLLLLPAWNGQLYAFDRQTLELAWQYEAGLPLRAAPLVVGESIYQPSGLNVLTALNMQGQSLWQQVLPAPLLSSPVSVPLGLAVIDKNGNLSCFTPDGSRLWTISLNQTLFYSTPLVARQALFIATAAGDLWKIDPSTGETIWTRSLAAPIYASPVASPLGVLVGDNQGTLHLIDFESGRSLASYKVEGPIQSKVLVTGNRLYFGSRSQNLHALELITGGGGAGE